MPSTKSPSVGDDFDHLITHCIVCTLEENDGCAMGHGSLTFGSLHEARKEVQEGVLNGCPEQGRMHQ